MSRIHFDRAYQLSGDDSSSIILATATSTAGGSSNPTSMSSRVSSLGPPSTAPSIFTTAAFDTHPSSTLDVTPSPVATVTVTQSHIGTFLAVGISLVVLLIALLCFVYCCGRRSRATADVADDEEIELGSVPKRRAGRAGAMPSGR
ncbi:unnamed protein product [Mycena citricolor]|uniref:Uncharacterized protein n=1 Tax=Mycena citricolor TaxID=2018698 RepID=A0AAD2K803_9AGAR|nr:unnamed protein product [Mycena citricolor]CAK5283856.1 unnamed protein product [Mycena citricolor]CAK5283872.1 unnamed protein product [Mycena citricolor]